MSQLAPVQITWSKMCTQPHKQLQTDAGHPACLYVLGASSILWGYLTIGCEGSFWTTLNWTQCNALCEHSSAVLESAKLLHQMECFPNPLGCSHTKSDNATKMQCFPFIVNETPCGTVARVTDASNNNFCCTLVRRLKLLSFLVTTVCITWRLPLACLCNLTPMKHSELQDPNFMLMSCWFC